MKNIKKVLIVAMVLMLFAAIALGSGSSDEGGITQGAGGNNSSEEKNENTSQTEFKVGESFVKDGFKIMFVSSSDYESDNMFTQPAEGNKFIRLYFYVENQSSSDKSLSTYDFTCYADGYKCEKTYADDDLSVNLSSGRHGDGAVYFEIPNNAQNVEIEYEVSIWTDKKIKFIFEGNKDSGFVPEKDTSTAKDALHVGDTYADKKVKINYLKSDEYVSDNIFLQPAEGMKYIYIELEMENISDSDQSISVFSFECYADGKHCESYYGMDNGLSGTISSGRKLKGVVAFEVPKDAEVIEIEYEDNIWTQKKIVFSVE